MNEQPRSNMFAYFSYPLARESLASLWPLSQIIPDFFLTRNHPFKAFHIKGISDSQGNQVKGVYITRLYLEKNFSLDMYQARALADIQEAARIAQGLGAKILGLGGFPSGVSDDLGKVAKKIKIPIASGNALFAWSIFEAVYWACRGKKIDLSNTKCAVIGATSALGALCSKKFATHVAMLVICDQDKGQLEKLKEKISEFSAVTIALEQDARRAVSDADIVIVCHTPQEVNFTSEDLSPGGIICDVSWCQAVSRSLKVGFGCSLVKGGLVKLPDANNLVLSRELGKNVICASLAEVMLLALDNNFSSYAAGSLTNIDKLEAIADRAAARGFEMWFP